MIKNDKIFTFLVIIAAFFSCSSRSSIGNDLNGDAPLYKAVLSRDMAAVKKLVDKSTGAYSANEKFETPLRLAAYMNQKDMVNLMLKKGVSVNYDKNELRSRNSSLFSDNIIKYPEKKKNFFLTFDAGDDNTNLNYILTTLEKYRIKATFFITGKFLKKYPDDVKRIVAKGHIAGNHTFSHAYNFRDEDHLLNELYETESIFKKISGKEMSKIWRAPYLRHLDKPWMLASARKLGYRHVDVSLYSKDWIDVGESSYLSNDRFIDIFKRNMNSQSVTRFGDDGKSYLGYRKKHADYHGIIMLMHAGAYRKNGHDFVYTLEDVILHVIACGYYFDNCEKFED